jgi:hypothetical protein
MSRRHEIMIVRKGALALGTFALALTLSLGVASVQAESVCKGRESGPCQKDDRCSWVESYKRKDGVKVSAHCKSKPEKSGKSEDTSKSGSK